MWTRTEVSGGCAGMTLAAMFSVSWLSSLCAPDCCEPGGPGGPVGGRCGPRLRDALGEAVGPLALTRPQRRTERDMHRCTRRPLGALREHASGAVKMNRDHGKAAVHAQVGGATTEGLGPAVG